MTVTRSFSVIVFMISLALLGLTGCASKPDVFKIKAQDEQWFCTPESEEEWRCQESSAEFKRIAKQRLAERERLEDKESSTTEKLELNESPVVVNETSSSESVDIENSFVEPELPSPDAEKPEELQAAEPDEAIVPVTDEERALSWWVVQLGAYSRESSALALMARLNTGELFQTEVKGNRYFTVVAVGFETQLEAQQFAAGIQSRHPDVSPWVRSGASLRRVLVP